MNTQQLDTIISTIVLQNIWIIPLIIWSLIWKAIALWKSARNNHLTVFVVITFLNTIGILEICYILYLYYKNKKTIKPQI